jgi:hypothetical protein
MLSSPILLLTVILNVCIAQFALLTAFVISIVLFASEVVSLYIKHEEITKV